MEDDRQEVSPGWLDDALVKVKDAFLLLPDSMYSSESAGSSPTLCSGCSSSFPSHCVSRLLRLSSSLSGSKFFSLQPSRKMRDQGLLPLTNPDKMYSPQSCMNLYWMFSYTRVRKIQPWGQMQPV